MINILYTSKFIRNIKKQPLYIVEEVKIKEKIFRKDIFDKKLRTHKLKGTLEGIYSFSVTRSYRILFKIDNKDKIIFLDIGDHSVYK